MSNTETRDIHLDDIVVDDEILLRPLSMGTAKDYEQAIRRGDKFPAVDVFDDGNLVRLADGRHRYKGYGLADRSTIPAKVHRGGAREARIFACLSNGTNGLPRSNADKAEAIRRLLLDDEWRDWNNSEIARRARVSHHLVVKVRKLLERGGKIPEQAAAKVKRGDHEYLGKFQDAPKPRKQREKPDLTPTQKHVGQEVRRSVEQERKKPARKPRLTPTDRAQRDKTFEFVDDNQTSPISGAEAVRRWDAYDRLEQFKRTRAWLDEAIAECERGKAEAA